VAAAAERDAGAVSSSVPAVAAGARRPAWAYGALLAALPLAQAALDRRWLFDGPGRDTWIYYGYFRFARVYLEEAASAYYSSRLSVILPGHLVRKLLPAVPANVVLHLGLYACAVAAFYGSTRIYTGRRGALLASLVLGCQPYFLWAMGTNYVPGFGLAYCLLALAAVTAAAGSRGGRAWEGLMAAAGGAATALVAANLFYALYLPLLAAHYLVLDRHGARRRLLPAVLWAAAGASVAFAVLDAVGRLWGHGAKVFLAPTVLWLWDFSKQVSIYKHPVAVWGPRAWWLVFPMIVLGGSLAWLLRRRWERRSPAPHAMAGGGGGDDDGDDAGARLSGLRVFVQLQFVAACAVMAACELEPHGVPLEYFYYAVLLLPPACLALAGQLAPLLDRLPPRVFGGLAVATAAVLAPVSVGRMHLWDLSSVPTIALPLAAGAIAVAVIAAGWRGLRPAVLILASLIASLLLTQNLFDSRRWGPGHSGYADTPRFFRQVDSVLTRLQAADPSLRLRLWYSLHEEDGRFYDSLACAWRLCERLVTYSFPDVAGGRMCDGQPLQPGMKVAVLTERPPPAAAAAAESALESIGLRARWLGAGSVPGPVKPVSLLFFETAALPRSRGPGGGRDHGLPAAGAAPPGTWRNGEAATAGRTARPR
jgi:hypothetical protein